MEDFVFATCVIEDAALMPVLSPAEILLISYTNYGGNKMAAVSLRPSLAICVSHVRNNS